MSDPEWHLNESMAAGLIANRLDRVERNRAVRHLLTGCDSCRMLVNRFLNLLGVAPVMEEDLPLPFHEASTRASATALDISSIAARRMWREMERLSPERRQDFLRSHPRHQSLDIFEAGLEETRKARHRDPAEALELAELLLVLAEMIEPGLPDQSTRHDLLADAHMALAQACSAFGDFRGARAAFDAVDVFLAYGTRDEIDRAMLLVHQAELLANLGEFERAVSLLDQALPLFQLAQDPNSEAKVLLQQASILRHIDPARALALADSGLRKLNLDQEPRAELSAYYTRAYCHNELGHTAQAEGILAAQRYRIDQFPEESVRLGVEWLQAKIRANQGRFDEAEQRLRAVLAGYLERNFRFEAVLTTIDLIGILVRQDRRAEGLYLVEEVMPILRVWGLRRDSLAILLLLAEHRPEKRFEEGSLPTPR